MQKASMQSAQILQQQEGPAGEVRDSLPPTRAASSIRLAAMTHRRNRE